MSCINRPWGYYCVCKDKVYIPLLNGSHRLRDVLADVYKKTKCKRMIFSAVINPTEFRKHLHHVIEERQEWSELHQDYSYCIEIEYQPQEAKSKEEDELKSKVAEFLEEYGWNFLMVGTDGKPLPCGDIDNLKYDPQFFENFYRNKEKVKA